VEVKQENRDRISNTSVALENLGDYNYNVDIDRASFTESLNIMS
jgi:hypothetical protein